MDADTVTEAFVQAFRHLVAALPAGWCRDADGAFAYVSGVQVATLNGVLPTGGDVEPGAVAGLLDAVGANALPHCLQLRPDADGALAELAERSGMTRDEDVPLMVLDDLARVAGAAEPAGLAVRQLAPDEAPAHVAVMAAGFGVPPELFEQLLTPEVLAMPGVRCYLGEAAGERVVTGLGVTLGDATGIFNVATPAAHRRKGYGAAVTARAALDGAGAGACWAWLQATELGHPVYERLGFRTLERWGLWVSGS